MSVSPGYFAGHAYMIPRLLILYLTLKGNWASCVFFAEAASPTEEVVGL